MAIYPAPQAHDCKGGKTPEQVAAAKAKTSAGFSNLNEVVLTWNAPRATDGSHGGPRQTGGSLPADAALAISQPPSAMCQNWANPMANDHQNSATYGGGSEKLTAQVRKCAPAARDTRSELASEQFNQQRDEQTRGKPLTYQATQAAAWMAPNTVDAAGGTRTGQGQVQFCHLAKAASGTSGSCATSQTAKSGVLNPELSRWLMGYRPEIGGQSPGSASWELIQTLLSGSSPSPAQIESARCEAMAMPSVRKPRRSL